MASMNEVLGSTVEFWTQREVGFSSGGFLHWGVCVCGVIQKDNFASFCRCLYPAEYGLNISLKVLERIQTFNIDRKK